MTYPENGNGRNCTTNPGGGAAGPSSTGIVGGIALALLGRGPRVLGRGGRLQRFRARRELDLRRLVLGATDQAQPDRRRQEQPSHRTHNHRPTHGASMAKEWGTWSLRTAAPAHGNPGT